jgi:hypothetical protein
MRTALTWFFRALAIGFLYAAGFHAAAYFHPSLEPRQAPLEHIIFVPVNLVFAVGTLLRPRWFVVAFALLVVEQLYEHGVAGWTAWRAGWLDWRSLVVVLSLPLAFALLVYDTRLRAAAKRAAA